MQIAGKEYAADDTATAFLESYLERVRTYVDANGIGKEYSGDIAARMAEKIEALGRQAEQKDAVKIVNDLWEPEEIFADVPRKTSKFAESAGAVRNSLKSPLYRDSSKGIIFWVCAGLWEKFDIDPLYVRLLFIFLFFFYGTGILAYLILALLLKDHPSTVKNMDSESSGSIVKSTVAKVPEVTVGVLGRVISLMVAVILVLIAFWLAMGSIALLVAAGAAFSDVSIANQILFAGVHSSVPAALATAGIALFILAWGAAFWAFGKHIAGNWLYVICATALAISLAMGTYGGMKTIGNFAHREKAEAIVLEARTGTAVTVILPEDSGLQRMPVPSWSEIRVIRSPDSAFRISSITEVSASDTDTARDIVTNIVPLTATGVGDVFKIMGDKPEFTKKTPMAFAKRTVVVSVPDGTGLKLQNAPWRFGISGVTVSELESYMNIRQCPGLLRYLQSKEAFACDPASFWTADIIAAKINYLENYAYSHAPRRGSRNGNSTPYIYNDNVEVKRLENWTYQVVYRLEYPHGDNVADEIISIYSVEVDSEGKISARELPEK